MDGRRHRSVRRAGPAGGAVTALLAVAACAGHATNTGLPWWAVLAVALSAAGPAGWTGSRAGRRSGPRDEPFGGAPVRPSDPARPLRPRPRHDDTEAPLRMR
ncbi:hypothetical protein ACFY3O_02910 [Streptomyces sp. NPDC001046]|uniref:hypothetical protein n=1 Tax=unclassified Streptomyces TaxID=2593676 RepID=UPI003697ADE8